GRQQPGPVHVGLLGAAQRGSRQNAAHLSFLTFLRGTWFSTEPTTATPASIRPWTRLAKSATRVEPQRATASAAPVRAAIMAASSPLLNAGVSTMTTS